MRKLVSIDTNILVRFLVKDDPEQADRARQIISANRIFIPKTVLLETEWVLRFSYRFSQSQIINAFIMLSGLPTIFVEDGDQIKASMAWYSRGMDFADALHLSAHQDVDFMATFDKALAKKAKQLEAFPVRLLSGTV